MKMIKYYNKNILRTIEELVDPKNVALVVVDVQNDFVMKDSELQCPKMVNKLKNLIESARKAGVIVIYLQDTLLPKRLSDSAPYFEKYMKYLEWCADAGMGIFDLSKIKVIGPDYKKHIIKYKLNDNVEGQVAWIHENFED